MVTNPYFNNGGTRNNENEQQMLNAEIIEAIQIYGNDVKYLPRKLMDPDHLFGEDPTSQFKLAREIEMYVENPADYGGEGEIMLRTGMQIKKTLTLIVSTDRFAESVHLDRPVEGDLIWHPVFNMIFQIMFVEDEPELWQLGNQYVFRLFVSTYEYSHETFDTGFEEIDQLNKEFFNDGTDSNGLKNDRGADNEVIKEVGEAATDFSETSPFGRF
jgi:hypothetical protein